MKTFQKRIFYANAPANEEIFAAITEQEVRSVYGVCAHAYFYLLLVPFSISAPLIINAERYLHCPSTVYLHELFYFPPALTDIITAFSIFHLIFISNQRLHARQEY